MKNKGVKFSNGAARSERKPRYDLVRLEFVTALAETLGEGAESYGDINWQLGGRDFARETYNHLFEHVMNIGAGDNSEDHISHAAANLMFLLFYKKRHPEWFDGGLLDNERDKTKAA